MYSSKRTLCFYNVHNKQQVCSTGITNASPIPNETTQHFSLNSLNFLNGGIADASKVRLHTVRDLHRLGLLTIDDIVSYYYRWVTYDEYMLLQRVETEPYKAKKKIKSVYRAVKCAKRGNDVYCAQTKKKIYDVGNLDNTNFFRENDRHIKAKTSAVSVTMTYDPKLCSLADAYNNLGKDFDAWLHKLRKKYGKISVFRTWEVCNNGYPHINAILLFHSKKFSVFRYKKKFRIREKKEFSDHWHSFVDVQAVANLKKSYFYAAKYITKYITTNIKDKDYDKKALLTLAMLWLFNKRSYAISRDFAEQVKKTKDFFSSLKKELRLDRHMRNSSQLTLNNEKKTKIEWIFLGIYSKKALKINGNSWNVEIPRLSVKKLLKI